MGRLIRSTLLRVPVVRRQMERLGAVETTASATYGRVATLERNVQVQHGVLTDRMTTVENGLAGGLSKVEAAAQDSNAATIRLSALEGAMHDQRMALGDRLAAVEGALHEQQVALSGRLAQVEATAREFGAGLASLQASVEAQQAALAGCLSKVETTAQECGTALVRLTEIEQSFRELSSAELIALPRLARDATRRPAVETLKFEQLLHRQVNPIGVDLAFNLHIPKTGGNTVGALLRQMGFVQLDLDMNRNDFFHTMREDRWFENYAAPPPRRAYLLSGHFRLDHPLLHRLWMPHVVITMLRDPVERMLSHYNFARLTPGSPWHEDLVEKDMPFVEYAKNMYGAIGPQYGFFDDTGQGTFARTGAASASRCLHNLLTRVSFYGLVGRFDEFTVMAGYLLRRGNILAVPAYNVTARRPNPRKLAFKTSLSEDEQQEITTLFKDDIWFYEEACREYERRTSHPRLQAAFAKALPVVKSARGLLDQLRDLTLPD
jgi:hypothetical protein